MTPEGRVIADVLAYLKVLGVFAWRNNTGASQVKRPNGSLGFVRYGHVGSSDIIGLLPDGTFLAVECKAKHGCLSEHQARFLADVASRGGVAIVARCIEDVDKGISAWRTSCRPR